MPHTCVHAQPFRLWMHEPAMGGVAVAEMLFCTSLLALVGAGGLVGVFAHVYTHVPAVDG